MQNCEVLLAKPPIESAPLAGSRQSSSADFGQARRAVASAVVLLGTLTGCSPASQDDLTQRSTGAIIYGEDDRVDLYAVSSESLRELALGSSVALVSSQALGPRADGLYDVVAAPLGEAANLCEGEPFRDQPTAADCSGVLLSDDLVLTAGHCTSSVACPDQLWVFDYAILTAGASPLLSSDDIYRCRRVLVRAHDRDSSDRLHDYAVLELDRAVTGSRRAAPVALDVAAGDALTVVGYPLGLPLKVDSGARVVDARPSTLDYFELTSDTFDRSSGSGVFDEGGRLVGVFVRGGTDFDYDSDDQCFVSRRIETVPEPGAAEQASCAAQAVAALCASGWNAAPCAPTDGVDADCSVGRARHDSMGWASVLAALALLWRRVCRCAGAAV